MAIAHNDPHLVGLWSGQAARQRAAVTGQGGGEGGTTVCQNGLKVAEKLVRKTNIWLKNVPCAEALQRI